MASNFRSWFKMNISNQSFSCFSRFVFYVLNAYINDNCSRFYPFSFHKLRFSNCSDNYITLSNDLFNVLCLRMTQSYSSICFLEQIKHWNSNNVWSSQHTCFKSWNICLYWLDQFKTSIRSTSNISRLSSSKNKMSHVDRVKPIYILGVRYLIQNVILIDSFWQRKLN